MIKDGIDEEFKKFNDEYLKKFYESEFPEEYLITDDSDEIKKNYKIVCRYPLVICENPSTLYYLIDTLLASDEYLVSEIKTSYNVGCGHVVYANKGIEFTKLLFTNKRLIKLSSNIHFYEGTYNNGNCSGQNMKQYNFVSNGTLIAHTYFDSTEYYRDALKHGYMLYEYDKSRHCLIVKHRDPYNPYHFIESHLITCPEMNYTLPMSFIKIITSQMNPYKKGQCGQMDEFEYQTTKNTIQSLFKSLKKKEIDMDEKYNKMQKDLEDIYEKKTVNLEEQYVSYRDNIFQDCERRIKDSYYNSQELEAEYMKKLENEKKELEEKYKRKELEMEEKYKQKQIELEKYYRSREDNIRSLI
jgi:hypothetical protein